MGRVLPGLQAHLRLRSVCPLRDKLCRRFAGDGPVQLDLQSLVERLRDLGIAVVVDAALLMDVGDLEIEAPLASPDGPDALQQFFKIMLAKPLSLLQTLIVEYESESVCTWSVTRSMLSRVHTCCTRGSAARTKGGSWRLILKLR